MKSLKLAVVVAFVVGTTSAVAATVSVAEGDNLATKVAEARALAVAGDTAVTVEIAPGKYVLEGEIVVDSGICVKGTSTREETIVQAAPDHRAFVITDGTVSTLTVRGATWTQGLPQDTTIGVNPSGYNFGYGVLLTTPGTPVLTNCVVENVAVPNWQGAPTRLGAGVATYDNSNALVTDCLVRNCSGDIGRGGGVYLWYGTLRNSVVTNNTSNGEGAGVSVFVGGNVYNCLIAYNTATSGDCGGLREQGWTYQNMYNNTVVHNVAKKAPAGIKVEAGTFRNCIVWGNTLSDDGSVSDVSGSNTGTLFYNCSLSSDPGGKAGSANNNFEDPQFADEGNGDFRLAEGSPCADTGDAGAVSATSPFDLDGLPRVFDATKTGTAVIDRGCYERNPAMYEASADFVRTSPAAIVVGAGSAFRGEFINRGKVETGATFTWDFGDGSDPVAVVGSGLAEHVYQAPGAYDVTLTATAGTASDTVTHAAIVRVYPADGVKTIHVAKTGGAVFPYATPENATPDLDRANLMVADLNALGVPVERLQVGDGEYTLSDEIVLTNGLVVASENGPEKTSVRQTTDNHRVFMVRDGMVSGFTAIGGAFVGSHVISPVTESDSNYRASGFVISARGVDATHLAVVTNCIVTGLTGGNVGGHGPVTLAGSNARMYDSVVRDIGAAGISGGGGVWLYYGGIMERCRVLNCSADEGGGVAVYISGSMRNSLVAGCTAKNQGGGAHFNTWTGGTDIYNNTVVSNTTLKGTSGGMVIAQCSWMNFINNIVAGNYGPDGEGNIAVTDKTALGATFKNNCVPGYPEEEIAKWTAHADNIDADPQFVETDDPAQQWHLKRTSPCVDKGNIYSQNLKDAVDLDGKPRIHRRKIDMGCFENDGTYGLLLIVR